MIDKKKQIGNLKNGFSLIELLLVIAIMGLIVGISIPFYQSFQLSSQIDTSTSEIVGSLRRAQIRSMANDFDDSWSVRIGTNSKVTLYKGLDFNTRNVNYDETFDIAPTITINGVTDINFDKLTGKTIDIGNINLQSTGGTTQTISVNSQGEVDY